jgi:methionine-rich copper-binding protein CopC
MRLMPLFVAAMLYAGPAFAETALVSSTPQEGASGGRITRITLTFSDALSAPASGVDLVMTTMPGMAMHEPMKMSGLKVSVSPDGRSLVVAMARALPAGGYRADWHVAGADGHRVTGRLSFTAQ